MKTDIEKLNDAERQKLADDLHALGVRPSILQGSGSPAHIAMLASTINDMRQVVSIQSSSVNRLFSILERQGEVIDKQSALIERLSSIIRLPNEPGLEPKLPGEVGH